MKERIESLMAELASATLSDAASVEQFRVHYLGRKGVVKALAEDFKSVPNDEKRAIGQMLNELKQQVQSRIDEALAGAASGEAAIATGEDLTRPDGEWPVGSRHAIAIVRREILDIFSRLGFSVAEGPEVEDDWHVFGGLNFPPDHPARDMQDTFFVEGNDGLLLRTHTSSVQVRVMESSQPPIRIVMPGRVFRNEAVSARSHCAFHQIEGLYIDKDVSFAD
jgi:phenylalanyl-tRNA synthetase alpha chain